MFPFKRQTHPRESLSAYLDGALAGRERVRLESHLEGCAACRTELEGLRAASEALRGLPAAAAPRSFALTPEMAGKPGRAPAGYSPALNTAMRLSAASLAVALATVMVVDRANLGGDSGTGTTERATRSFGENALEMTEAAADSADSPSIGAAERLSGATPAPQDTQADQRGVAAGGSVPSPLADNTDQDTAAGGEGSPRTQAPVEEQYAASPPEGPKPAADSVSQDDGGIGAIGVIEILLAIAFGSCLGGVVALTASRGRAARGTNR